MGGGDDKRVFRRFAVEVSAELETAGGRIHRANSRNLSRGGICLETIEAVAAGEEVAVRVALVFDEDRSSEPLELPARVVWCTSFGNAHQVGTRFLPLSEERATYLDMFLRFIEQHESAGADEDAGGDRDEDDPFAT